MRQKPGQSNVDRSLGSTEEKIKRRLKTTDTTCERPNQDEVLVLCLYQPWKFYWLFKNIINIYNVLPIDLYLVFWNK